MFPLRSDQQIDPHDYTGNSLYPDVNNSTSKFSLASSFPKHLASYIKQDTKRHTLDIKPSIKQAYLWVFFGIFHDFPPHSLHGGITFTLYWQLSVDVLGTEDGFQI